MPGRQAETTITRIEAGLDLPIAGDPAGSIGAGPGISSVALSGEDYGGLRPAMRVEEGDRVKLGQTLFEDRKRPSVQFTSPGSGVVSQIVWGPRRSLKSVVIRLDGDEERDFSSWPAAELGSLRRDQVIETLLESGLWPSLRTRPFGRAADPESTVRSIFVTAMDTNPLAPDPMQIIETRPDEFRNGLAVISHLAERNVFVCQGPSVNLPIPSVPEVSVRKFSGPHPAGLVGTHIHHLDPVSAARMVWHIGYQDVISIGHLFTTGRLLCERLVSLAGPMIREPRVLRTRMGASITDLTRDAMIEGACRVISGSVLSGRHADGASAYLGRYDNQVSVIGERDAAADSATGSSPPNWFSIYRGLGSRPWGRKKFPLVSSANRPAAAMVPFGGFERVMPLDILPTQLLRALLVGDLEAAEALGCLELDEEDLALCTTICPSKLDYGPMLRSVLDMIEKEG